jgi:hypothetical protein
VTTNNPVLGHTSIAPPVATSKLIFCTIPALNPATTINSPGRTRDYGRARIAPGTLGARCRLSCPSSILTIHLMRAVREVRVSEDSRFFGRSQPLRVIPSPHSATWMSLRSTRIGRRSALSPTRLRRWLQLDIQSPCGAFAPSAHVYRRQCRSCSAR